MGLIDVETYVRSRVGAVFSEDHAERVIELVHQVVADLTAELDSQKDSVKDEQTEKELASRD